VLQNSKMRGRLVTSLRRQPVGNQADHVTPHMILR
jgi:hypothetical protein